jgi:uncharacterized radical SAM protein YgiQ
LGAAAGASPAPTVLRGAWQGFAERRFVELPSADDVATSKSAYAAAFMAAYGEQDPLRGNILYQRHSRGVVVQNPPAPPLSMEEMDRIYALPYERAWHPSYDAAGGVPALEEVKFSVASHRGCFGGCSFCAITFHQGRIVQKRSFRSILAEVAELAAMPDFKGYIHDVGGPTANFRNPSCKKQLRSGTCKNRQCLYPRPCPRLEASHSDYLALLRKVREQPGVKKAFVRSGIRFDFVMLDRDRAFLRELCEHHVSGQLKVAPEHVSRHVLDCMGKPGASAYEAFCHEYLRTNMRLGIKQYLVPYLISGHPGSTLADAVQLSEYLCEKKYSPEQVQDFYPTPGTMSSCMHYTGIDPRTMKKIHIPSPEEKAMQRALLQYRRPENRQLVMKALKLASRGDLIGYEPTCLVRPDGGRPARPAKTSRAARPAKPGMTARRVKAAGGVAIGRGSAKAATGGHGGAGGMAGGRGGAKGAGSGRARGASGGRGGAGGVRGNSPKGAGGGAKRGSPRR